MSNAMVLDGHRWCALSIHWSDRSARPGRFSGWFSHFVSKRSIKLAEPSHRPVTDHPAHRRVAAQPVGIAQVLVAGQPPEYRLAQQAAQPMASFLVSARIGARIATHGSQAHCIVQLARGKQSVIVASLDLVQDTVGASVTGKVRV
jgi:hypothetical protein